MWLDKAYGPDCVTRIRGWGCGANRWPQSPFFGEGRPDQTVSQLQMADNDTRREGDTLAERATKCGLKEHKMYASWLNFEANGPMALDCI